MLHVVRCLVHELRARQSHQIDDHTLVLTGAHIVYVDVCLGRYPREVYPTPEHPLYENNERIRAHAEKQDDERDARPFARSILYDPLMILHRLHVSDAHAVKLVGVSPIRHSHRVPWNSLSVLPTFALQTKYQLVQIIRQRKPAELVVCKLQHIVDAFRGRVGNVEYVRDRRQGFIGMQPPLQELLFNCSPNSI